MKKDFFKGFFKENPVFVILLGLCPALGVTSKVEFAIGMGAGVIFVLLGSNIFVSLLKNFIPEKIRIPAYIVIIASFVTIVEMLMKAFVPPLYNSLGVFVPLIVVNCVILGRAEAFASQNSVGKSIIDALGMGLGFTIALVAIAFVRELLGNGTIFGLAVPLLSKSPIRVFGFAAGALLVIGYLKALWDVLLNRRNRK
jgi:Na+-translocating ferredoxin:NAD+ oxidoreductase subunit E